MEIEFERTFLLKNIPAGMKQCKTAGIDIYLDELEGLGVVDFEFTSRQEKDSFKIPDFCLAEVTQDEIIAGGILAGKKYSDIELLLNKYNYKKIK